jgi:hypothetical protein
VESERLARRYFALFASGRFEEMLALVDPEAEFVLKTVRPGEVVRGTAELERFVAEISGGGGVYEAAAEVYRPLDDSRVVVEGRIRWTDDERVLRDDPMIWALEFREGLLFRSTPAQTVLEAETILARPLEGPEAGEQ